MIIYYILYIQRSDSKAALFLLRQGVDVNLTAEATGSTALHLLSVLQLAAHRYCLLQCILYSVLHLAVHRGLRVGQYISPITLSFFESLMSLQLM